MAPALRSTNRSVADLLFESGYEFDFFQAVRLLQWLKPSQPIVSGLGEPPDELVRFRAHLSAMFPASSIHRVDENPGSPVHMLVAFMGLTGPNGILPAHYTEFLIERKYEKDQTSAAFFDLFNHRLIALFYRAWEKHRFAIGFELDSVRLASNPPAGGRFTQYLFDLIGLGTAGLRDRLQVPGQALLAYSGLIAQAPHSASALEGLLRDYFGVGIQVDQFRGRWVALDEENLSYLNREGLHNQLGLGTIAGDAVWNGRAGILLRVGPLPFHLFQHFLPNGSAFSKLASLVQFFAGPTVAFEVQLVLEAAQVPDCRLPQVDSGDGFNPRLGWTSWLKSAPFDHDASDVVLRPSEIES